MRSPNIILRVLSAGGMTATYPVVDDCTLSMLLTPSETWFRIWRARVYTSDLRRAVQTAEPVATALGVEVDKRPGLREISYGDAEGRPQRWLDERFVPAPTTSAGRLDHRFGLPDAETKREFGTRVYATLQSILREKPASGGRDARVRTYVRGCRLAADSAASRRMGPLSGVIRGADALA